MVIGVEGAMYYITESGWGHKGVPFTISITLSKSLTCSSATSSGSSSGACRKFNGS